MDFWCNLLYQSYAISGSLSQKMLPSRMTVVLASQDHDRLILCPLLVSTFSIKNTKELEIIQMRTS